MEFIVVAVATVLAIRFALFITGYPQLGGSGLHIAHVLWGGLLMAVGVMGLLSFNGRVIRPVGSFLAGVGFGLFIDEVGKFLTSNNDYFFTPSIAIMYVLIVLLVLGIHALHGRRPLGKRELYVAALNTAAAGASNGMTDNSRALALRRINAAADLPGAAQAAALVREIPSGRAERYDVSQIGTRVARKIARALRTRPAMITTVVLLLLQTVVTLGIALLIVSALIAREVGANADLRFTDPVPTAVGGASAILSAACVVYGVMRLRQKRRVTGYRWLQRAVLIDLLLTRVFEFAVYQFAAIPALVIDLLLLGVLEFAIRNAVAKEEAVDDGSAEAAEAGRRSPALGAAPVAARSGLSGSLPAGAVATASLGDADGVRNAADIGPLPAGPPGGYPGALSPSLVAASGSAIVTGRPSAVAEPSPGGKSLPAEPPALGGPAAAPAVLPGAAVGGPGPYFATLSVAGAADRGRESDGAGRSSSGAVSVSGDEIGALPGSGDAVPPAAGGSGGDTPDSGPGLASRMRLAFTGGCRSHAGVIGGALSAGCGAIAGGLVAGVSTRSAAVHGDSPAAAGGDASDIVGEVLDDAGSGDHDALPPLGGTAGAAGDEDPGAVGSPGGGDRGNARPLGGSADGVAGTGGSASHDVETAGGPGSVGGQPPPATWIGSRTGNAGSGRYRSAERGERAAKANAREEPAAGSNVESQRRMTPPPLS